MDKEAGKCTEIWGEDLTYSQHQKPLDSASKEDNTDSPQSCVISSLPDYDRITSRTVSGAGNCQRKDRGKQRMLKVFFKTNNHSRSSMRTTFKYKTAPFRILCSHCRRKKTEGKRQRCYILFLQIYTKIILKQGRALTYAISPNYTPQEILAIIYVLMQKNYMLSKIP